MNVEHLHDLLEANDGRIEFGGTCHDCGADMSVSATAMKDGIEIEGGAVYDPYGDDRYYVRCNSCYGENPKLDNYQECLVYARCVGYLTPTKQWNEAKQAEFKDRKMYNIPDMRA